MFRQIHDFPKLVVNATAATSTDTIHRLRILAKSEAFLASYYTHLTAASAEIEGRSYGGGVLELEPREAENLLMPREVSVTITPEEIDRLLRANSLDKVLETNDGELLRKRMGLSSNDCSRLKEIWIKLRDRRMARKRRNGRDTRTD
jgi:adenine-specific DNA methylase